METNDSGAPLSGRRCQPIDGGQDYEALRLDAPPPLSPSNSVPPPPLFFFLLFSPPPLFFLLFSPPRHPSPPPPPLTPPLPFLSPPTPPPLPAPPPRPHPPPLLMETLQGEVFWTAGASGSDAGVPSSEGWEQTQAGTTSDSPLGSSRRQKKKGKGFHF